MSSKSPSLTLSPAVCCAQIQIAYSILSSIVPCLKTFIVAFDEPSVMHTEYIMEVEGDSITGSSSDTLNVRKKLDAEEGAISWVKASDRATNIRPRVVGDSEPDLRVDRKWILRPEDTIYEACIVSPGFTSHEDGLKSEVRAGEDRRVYHGEGTGKTGNVGAERMVIKKGVEWRVEHISTVSDARTRSKSGRNAR